MVLGVMILFFGAAVQIKADVGIGTYDAFVVSIADVTGVSKGAMVMAANFLLIMVQILAQRKKFEKRELLQFPYMLLIGFVMNFYVDFLLVGWLAATPYWLRLLISTASNSVRSLGVMLIFESRLMKTPLEAVADIVAQKTGKTMGRIVQYFDVFFIVSSLVLSLVFKKGFRVREGTAIAMLMFGPLMDILRRPVRKVFDKLGV